MLALYRCGRQAEALRAFQRLRTVLGDELGIEPSPKLVALEDAIILHKPHLDWDPAGADIGPGSTRSQPMRSAADGPRAHNIPASTPLVGRDVELATVDRASSKAAACHRDGDRWGGKTRLALAAAASASRVVPSWCLVGGTGRRA